MPLRRIALRDFVIVRELELELAGGFTVLTGETGAGKSILIDALQLALGARAEAGAVREGASRAGEFASDVADGAVRGGRKAVKFVSREVKEHPLRTLAIGAAVGAVVAAVIMLRNRDED